MRRRSYKLRLGDGTVLVVDHEGLSSWLGDRRALVQPAGSDLWKPLKEFLIQERAAARRAARQRPKSPSTPREALPLVYPKPREKPASGPPKQPIPVRADRLPLIPPPPPKPRDDPDRSRRRAVPAPPATVVRPSLPKPPAPPVLRKPTPPLAPPPPEAPPPLMPPRPPDDRVVVRPSLPKTPPAPVLARQPAEPGAGDAKPTTDPGLAGISPPPGLIPPKPPTLSPAPPIITPAPPTITPAPPTITPPPIVSATPPAVLPPPIVSLKPLDDRDKVPAPSVPRATVAPPAGPTVVQPLTEKPATFSTESASPLLASDEDVGWMKLPKPVDDEPSTLPAVSWIDPLQTSSASVRPSSASVRPSLLQEAPLLARSRAPSAFETLLSRFVDSLARLDWQKARLWLMSQAASAYGALLAPWKNLARGDRPLPSASPGEPAPLRVVDAERSAPLEPRPPVGVPLREPVRAEKRKELPGVYSPRRSTDDGLPILQLEPLDDDGGSADDLLEIDLEPLDEEVPAGVASKPSKLEAKASAPLVRELPVPRPADLPRPKQVEGVHEAERRLPASPWTKRLAVMGGLVAAGLFAALSSETWAPKAAPPLRVVVSETDPLKQSRERLPHLAPETIRLVMARSATGVLDPPAVFRVTCDAVERGSWALTREEAQELEALRRELLDALLPSEAERVLEYDGARARRATLPFENRAALDLFARGARALPSRSRARLQLLFGKAVAAQLRAEGADRP